MDDDFFQQVMSAIASGHRVTFDRTFHGDLRIKATVESDGESYSYAYVVSDRELTMDGDERSAVITGLQRVIDRLSTVAGE